MALRLRHNGQLLCAKTHNVEPSDIYIDDNMHYRLVGNKNIVPDSDEKQNGIWYWYNKKDYPKEI